jgi:hypothetical protein
MYDMEPRVNIIYRNIKFDRKLFRNSACQLPCSAAFGLYTVHPCSTTCVTNNDKFVYIRVGRYQKFQPRYVSWKNIAILDISRYYFLVNSGQQILGNNWLLNAFVTLKIGPH